MAVAIILLNILIIATFTNIRGGGEVMNVYLVSLALADLLYGVLVVPFSVYPALVQQWVYGLIVCRIIGYIEVALWTVSAYTLMWISVDRYIAVRKPVRYFTVQTRTRCQCWMAFTWISSAMLCCPPLLEFSKPTYEKDIAVCMLDWHGMAAYSVTLSILVLGPSLITILYTYVYIYGAIRRLRRGFLAHDKEYVTALSENLSNPTHVTSFVLIVSFWVCWTPFMSIKAYQQLLGGVPVVPGQVHFAALWLGISNSVWKAFVLIFLSPQFRVMLRLLCLTVFCKRKSRAELELLQLDMEDHFL